MKTVSIGQNRSRQRLENETKVQFNKKLFKAFQAKGIKIGAIPDLETTLISDHLIEQGLVDPALANSVLEEVTGTQGLDPSFVSFEAKFIEHITILLPGFVAREETVFPVKHENEYIHMVMAVPQDRRCIERLASVTGSRIKPYCCNGPAIIAAIDKYYNGRMDVPEPLAEKPEILIEKALQSANRLKTNRAGKIDFVNDVHLIRLFQHVMNKLVQNGASDLHLEPRENDLRIRYRKDGVMQTAFELPSIFKAGFLQRLKMLAGMEMDNADMPQDGSIRFGLVKDRAVDIRVSSLPSLYGETIVMRVLERNRKQLLLKDLGMKAREADLLEKAMGNSTGLILVTGPTGSGKTTTLYAILNALNSVHVNIVTAEDPVEYSLEGLTQVNCNAEIGLTFDETLRTFMRQDPDIIMVGEIRDLQTADIALKAAMTGHLVLSTLHTNDAPGTINRLINMGIPPYLVTSTQMTVIAQRLVRRLCEKCKQEFEPETGILKAINMDNKEMTFFMPMGCEACSGTGYNGRLGIYELMQVNERTGALILNKAPAQAIKDAAIADGMETLREAALGKLAEGVTTIEEVFRVTMDN